MNKHDFENLKYRIRWQFKHNNHWKQIVKINPQMATEALERWMVATVETHYELRVRKTVRGMVLRHLTEQLLKGE